MSLSPNIIIIIIIKLKSNDLKAILMSRVPTQTKLIKMQRYQTLRQQ